MEPRLILYIEDDDATFNLVRMILEEESPQIELLRASDHLEAMAILLSEKAASPDLILLDLNLPQKSGLEILSDLKASDRFQAIPVVIFSTSSAVSDQVKALAGGAHAYITKPSNFDLFVKAVKSACTLPDPGSGRPLQARDSAAGEDPA